MTKAVFPMDHGDWKVDWDEYINEYLQFKHSSIEQQYLQMRIQRAYSRHHRQHSYWMIGLSCIALLSLWTIFINAWLIFESNSHKPANLIFNAIAIIFAILTALVTSRLLCSSSSIPFPLLSPAPIQPTRSPPISQTSNSSSNNNDDLTPMTSTRTLTTTLPSSFTYLQRIHQYQILFFLLINVQVLMNYINFILDISSCNYNKDTPCFSSNMKVSIIQGTSLLPFLLTFLLYDENLFVILISISNLLIIYLTFGTWWSFFPKLLIALILLFMKLEYRKLRIESFLIHLTYLKIVKEHEKRESKEVRATIGNITHDLRTPITAFSLGIENLQEICSRLKANVSSSLYNPLAESIKNLQSTNASLLMTFNRCIDYTKASKGMKLVPKYETVDLREALQFPIECMSNIQERIGIKLEAMSETICSHIITDKQWLQENLLCLLSNAVKYSPDDCEVVVRVSLEEYEKPHSIFFPPEDNSSSVTLLPQCHVDSNANIEVSQTELFHQNTRPLTVSHRRHRFLQIEVADFSTTTLNEKDIEMFFSDPQQLQRMVGGTGIGLYTLARRLEALQGYWGASKQKNGLNGNIFWFAIPFEPYQGRKFKEKAKPRLDLNHDVVVSITETENDSSKVMRDEMSALSLLVVDDSPAILKMSSMMLKRQGHQIWTAENGEIALKRIEEKWRGSGKGFDLVLMDLQMPVMDGLEATRRLRGMESEGREWMVTRSSAESITTQDEIVMEEKNDIDDATEIQVGTKIMKLNSRNHQVIIGLSANSDHETNTEAIQAGVDDFFSKPFSLETFYKTMNRYNKTTN